MAASGAYILGCAGPRLDAEEARFFARAAPLGFILFDRNLEDADQIRALTEALRATVGRDSPILIDQEGGRVQRLRPPQWRGWPPPLEQIDRARALGADAGRAMYLRYRLIASELTALGIDTNCAPMADIADATTHPFLRNRCYGTEPETVIALSRAVARGLQDGGVLPVLKHIPGHGRATADSHLDLPCVTDSAEVLRHRDFVPFAALADLPMAMTAHIVYSAFDAMHPATTSDTMIGLIRNELGFKGLLMSDDISMQALQGSIAARSTAAIAAGCDVVLHCNGDLTEMQAVADAVGPLSTLAAHRAATALASHQLALPIDIAATEAELSSLLQGNAYD